MEHLVYNIWKSKGYGNVTKTWSGEKKEYYHNILIF